MAYNRIQARKICTQAEYELFELSLPTPIAALSCGQLKSKLQRSRNLRDKYRDLYKRQRLAARQRTGTKKGSEPAENLRTYRKEVLFSETMVRYQRRLEKLTAQAARASATKARVSSARALGGSKPAGGKAARGSASTRATNQDPSGPGGFITGQAQSAAQKRLTQKTRSKARVAHTRSAGQRSQARRDGGKKR